MWKRIPDWGWREAAGGGLYWLVRQYGYAFQAFSWKIKAPSGANIWMKLGTLLHDSETEIRKYRH